MQATAGVVPPTNWQTSICPFAKVVSKLQSKITGMTYSMLVTFPYLSLAAAPLSPHGHTTVALQRAKGYFQNMSYYHHAKKRLLTLPLLESENLLRLLSYQYSPETWRAPY